MDCLPLLAVELDESELRLENFEPALICRYSIFLDKVTVSFKYIGFVRILDLRWKLTTRKQIWIFVDPQFHPNHCELLTCQTPPCTH